MNQEKLGNKIFLLVVMLLLSGRVGAAAEPRRRGVDLAQACATCHGPDGQSSGAIPSLNAMSKEAFVESLGAFQSGERQGTVMNRIAKGLDEADIAAIVEYFMKLRQKEATGQ
ncbi:MAG: cytochrome c [Candidatus Binatia bacterium]